jgi:hypothetical protein
MKTTDVIIVADVSGSMSHLQSKQQDAIYALLQQMAAEEKDHVFLVSIHPFGSTVGGDAPARLYDPALQPTAFKPASAYARNELDVLRCDQGATRLLDAVGYALEQSKPRNAEATLIQVFTDGGENASTKVTRDSLKYAMAQEMAKDRLTVAVTGPRAAGDLLRWCGLPDDNFRPWDGQTAESYRQTVTATSQSLSTFTQERKAGRTRSIRYYADATKLTTPGIRGMTKKVEPSEVKTVSKHMDGRAIADFFKKFEKGRHYYQLVKPEYIDEDKDLVVHDKQANEYRQGSRTVRMLLNLPEQGKLRVYPGPHSEKFDIYVQSASVNRKLVEGQKLLTL